MLSFWVLWKMNTLLQVLYGMICFQNMLRSSTEARFSIKSWKGHKAGLFSLTSTSASFLFLFWVGFELVSFVSSGGGWLVDLYVYNAFLVIALFVDFFFLICKVTVHTFLTSQDHISIYLNQQTISALYYRVSKLMLQ